MSAYYNEFDPKAAAWLRELMADGLIAPGEVDERDIRDVTPDELRPFQQVHLFAGIGGWSAALRLAGWPDDRPIWSASCPCQPFSAAGGRGGFADERHLWPAVYHLAAQCRPAVLLGEQSSSKDGLAWIDLVSSDMEAADYAGGPLDLCSAGFGAPNIRGRLYFAWLADAQDRHGRGRECAAEAGAGPDKERWRGFAGGGAVGGLAYPESNGRQRRANDRDERRGQRAPGLAGAPCRVADTDGRDARTEGLQRGREHGQRPQDASDSRGVFSGATNGFWRSADWVLCRDDDGPAWRPVEPGSFPLAPSIPGRVALLRGAGNAINLEVAAGFIEAVMETTAAQASRLAA